MESRTVPLTGALTTDERKAIDEQIESLRAQLEVPVEDMRDARRDHTALLVGSTMGIAFVAVIAIVVIFVMRPDKDNSSLVATLLGFLVPLMTALLAAAVQQLHSAVNGRLTQLLKATAAKSNAEGRAEGLLLAHQQQTALLQAGSGRSPAAKKRSTRKE